MSNKVYETEDYDIFELHELNRDVRNLKKVSNLKNSMKSHGFLSAYPLHTVLNGEGKLQIKAGHHRPAWSSGRNIYECPGKEAH